MSTTPQPRAELLAPAGDWDALRAAVACGADAVYFGLANFNARHRATNFSRDELPEVIGFLHRHLVRGYVTLNTLIFSDELPELAETVAAIAQAGADAVIVQDLGVAALVHQLAPQLPIHASTQTTLAEPRGIALAKELGVDRVILPRELSLDEIGQITSQAELPVEVFVHGALCVAYSGQCLTSEAIGGRSANRGQCAQACRLPYELLVDGQRRELGDVAYLLSPQDLAAYNLVDDLVKRGVCSLKIEGRLKSAQYVAVATQTYRAALDAALAGQQFQLDQQATLDLQQTFSRGFSPGFLRGVDHQELVQGRFPKSRGVFVGTLVEAYGGRATIELADGVPDEVLRAGDGIVFDEGHPERDEQGGRLVGVRLLNAQPGYRATTRRVEIELLQGAADLSQVTRDARVWKTDDPQLRRRVQRAVQSDEHERREPIDAVARGNVGGALTLVLRDGLGREASAAWPGPLTQAIKHPLTVESLRQQLDRFGDTSFCLGNVAVETDAPVMVPKSVLNELRRQAVATLEATRQAQAERTIDMTALDEQRAVARQITAPHEDQPRLAVLARTMDQLEAVLAWSPSDGLPKPAIVYCDFEDVRRYRPAVEHCRAANMPVGVATLRVIKPGEEGWLVQIARSEPDVVLVRNLAAISYFRQHRPELSLVSDYSLNVANELTAAVLERWDVERITPSHDLNWEQFQALMRRIDPGLFEAVVHHHMPMFHMEHCVFAHTLSDGKDWRDCGRPCDTHRVELRDRAGAEFPIVADAGCRNTVFHNLPQSAAEYLGRMSQLGVRWFRVELLREAAADVAPLLEHYASVLAGRHDGRSAWRSLQVLNQVGLTRGTLQMS
ncbi:MAG: U32 family peptidase [Planctomycetes bacterium]|nr:U32 family peptidase [Planctomycetota bacterium]